MPDKTNKTNKTKKAEYLDMPISIFSYNVFWKIMKKDSSLITKKIDKKKLTELKFNLLKNISNVKNNYIPTICCFQESENYAQIIKLFGIIDTNDNKFISDYKFHIGYSNPEHILTLWNKFVLKKKFIINGKFEQGRPFVFIIFEDLRFHNIFAFINLHAGHDKNTQESIFDPIQQVINSNSNVLEKFNITRIIASGDFNRDINEENQISNKLPKYYLKINKKKYYFISNANFNKTCCSVYGYGHNRNYDHVIDTYDKPIITHQLNKEKWYKIQSSDHIGIFSIVNNYNYY